VFEHSGRRIEDVARAVWRAARGLESDGSDAGAKGDDGSEGGRDDDGDDNRGIKGGEGRQLAGDDGDDVEVEEEAVGEAGLRW